MTDATAVSVADDDGTWAHEAAIAPNMATPANVNLLAICRLIMKISLVRLALAHASLNLAYTLSAGHSS